MMWSRGHQNDWDDIASEAGDKAWSYESVLTFTGPSGLAWFSDPDYRGAEDLLHRPHPSQPNRTRSAPGCRLGRDPDV